MDFKNKYLKYKKKYIILKEMLGGAHVVGTIDKTDEIKRILVEEEGGTYANLDAHFSEINNYGTIINTSRAYKEERYKDTKNIQLDDEIIYYRNPDISLEYQFTQDSKYFQNVNLNRLNRNDSNGSTEWISYNWALVENENKYILIFSQSNNDESEIGIKHSYIGSQNKLIFSGECRIIINGAKIIYQFNTNSSSAPSYDLPRSEENKISNFLKIKIKKILNLFITAPDNEEVQLTNTHHFINTGLNPDDETIGLLYYYKLKNTSAPYKTVLNALSQNIHNYNKSVSDDKKILYTPLISKDFRDNNLIYIQLDKDNSIALKKSNDQYDFSINPNLTDLSYLDEMFLKFGLNKFNTVQNWNGPVNVDYDFGAINTVESQIKRKFDESKLKIMLENYHNNVCKVREHIYTPKDLSLDGVRCWQDARGSGSTLLILGDKIIKTYLLNDLDKTKFWAEGWASDYIQRKISSAVNADGSKITDNFVTFYDIFQCPRKLIENDPNCSRYMVHAGNYGNIVMERIDGTLSDLPDNKYDCGVLFEFLYGKLVAFKLGKIIFTDQVNTGNCGFKTVDYCRKYTIHHAGSILEIYVKNNYLVKIFDFDSFKLKDKEDQYYSDISDIIPDGGGLYNYRNNFVGAANIITKQTTYFREKIRDTEKLAFIAILGEIRQSFLDNNQTARFLSIINRNIPADYKIPPPAGVVIKSYVFHI